MAKKRKRIEEQKGLHRDTVDAHIYLTLLYAYRIGNRHLYVCSKKQEAITVVPGPHTDISIQTPLVWIHYNIPRWLLVVLRERKHYLLQNLLLFASCSFASFAHSLFIPSPNSEYHSVSGATEGKRQDQQLHEQCYVYPETARSDHRTKGVTLHCGKAFFLVILKCLEK